MDQLTLSPEDKLLIYCSRVNVDDEIKLKVKDIMNEVLNWDYILDCSAKQGASPLLYWNLSKISNGKDVPYEIMKSLEKMYYSNLARNMLLYEELGKTLKAFNRAGIDTIVMKGAFLAEKIYKNIALRPMIDIDLLINEEDLQKAKEELNKLMYFPAIIFPTKLYEQFQTVLYNDLPFINQTTKVYVEIHWNIQPVKSNYKVNINEFWNNTKSVKIAGTETLTFAPEDLVQHLCLHLDKHIRSNSPPAKPLRDYCDIAAITKHYEEIINWEYLLKSSKFYEIQEPIFQNLSIANEYFGAVVPESILSKFESFKPKVSFQEIYKKSMDIDSSKINNQCEISDLTNLNQIDGTCNKLRIVFGRVFPSKEFMIHRYSIKDKKQVYIYYSIRSGSALRWGLQVLLQLPTYLHKFVFSK